MQQSSLTHQKIFNLNCQTNNVRIFPRDLSIAYEKKYYYNTHFAKQSYLAPFSENRTLSSLAISADGEDDKNFQ